VSIIISSNDVAAFGGKLKSQRNKRILIALILIMVIVLSFYVASRSKSGFGAKKTLTVFAYTSFVSSWGPGPRIKKEFEDHFNANLEFVDVGDAGLLVQRLKFIDNEKVDVVLGLDQLHIVAAGAATSWMSLKEINFEPSKALIELGLDRSHLPEGFLPFDWSPMSFVYKKTVTKPPTQLAGLLDERFRGKISIPDPHSSTPGLQFVFFVLSSLGEQKGVEFLKHLALTKPKITSSWSTSYGLYQKGQVDLTFSYLTSPVYHWIEESDLTQQPVLMTEPSVTQVEFAGIPQRCTECELAVEFVHFLLQPEMQAHIMNKNYMFPVIEGVVETSVFKDLPPVTNKKLEINTQWSKEDLIRFWEMAFK
jgi:thiamine transport system substrate-binding protein